MRKLTVLLLLAAGIASGQEVFNPGSIKIDGFVGKRIDECIATRVKGQDVKHLTEPFHNKTEHERWQSEFWGKWVQGAIASYRYAPSDELYAMIRESVDDMISTQDADGYIGNYAPDAHLKQWDVWGRKYTALGLMAWYRLSGEERALAAATRLVDHLMTEVGPDATPIVRTGNYHGMASSSVLEPVVYLYSATKDKKYLDFANYIVSQWETPEGPHLVTKALEGVPVAERYPHPSDWFSPENGQKAYEMMSCYVGLLELYKITGNPTYLDVVEKTVKNIVDDEINVVGSGSAFECWYHGREFQTMPTYHTMETCVTFTWMQLCDKLLNLTGKSSYADLIERSLYNALLASLKDDASQIAKYSPIEGHRFEGEEQCGMHINCCNANGPRGFAMIPEYAAKQDGRNLYVNFYGDMSAGFTVGKRDVTLTQKSAYPVENSAKITVNTAKPVDFSLNLRIPVWSARTKVLVNGEEQKNVAPGQYFTLDQRWKNGDTVELFFDMPVTVAELNDMQAIQRGPIVFARDSRFADGFVDESAVIATVEGTSVVKDAEIVASPDFAWITLKVPVTLGANLECDDADKVVTFCDFASAGNSWAKDVRYRVWIPKTLNIKLKRRY